ncbi:MAG TPA: glutamate-cysteine ligase family protein [Chitinispirillaceae bacterium]|nr:glutamate-cysteine ligase family protein [Chitinispirillaceae bacterium]
MYHIFEKFGIELEYMIVNRDTLRVLPITDKVIEKACGSVCNEIKRGEISWSNELVLHVIELKTSEPVQSLFGIADQFHNNILQIQSILGDFGGCLLPGPMHPFMDPHSEMKLWPHDYNPIYESFNRIFCCKGHGWANLQSMHINLPFADDDEFGRLHAAIRLVLPIIPALSAGSPVADGKITGFKDTRMEVYRSNSLKIPSITADIIPEPVFSSSEYQKQILERIYQDLQPYDPDKILQEEWVNARGAIARFERNTIEIRVIDVQETPFADIAIAAAVIGVIRMITDERFCTLKEQKAWQAAPLKDIFLKTIKYGEEALIDDSAYLTVMGMHEKCTAQELWKHLIRELHHYDHQWIAPFISVLDMLLNTGTLSSRILRALGAEPDNNLIQKIYRALGDNLTSGSIFKGYI